MEEISMGCVAPAFVAQMKEVTRRTWKPCHAQRFVAGKPFTALSALRHSGGQDIGMAEMTEPAYQEEMGTHDTEEKIIAVYKKEGMEYLEDKETLIMLDLLERWILGGGTTWVLPFKIVKVEPWAVRKFSKPAEIRRARNKLVKQIMGCKRNWYQCSICQDVVLKLAEVSMGRETIHVCKHCQRLIDEGNGDELARRKIGPAKEELDKDATSIGEKGVEGRICPECDTVLGKDDEACPVCAVEQKIEGEEPVPEDEEDK